MALNSSPPKWPAVPVPSDPSFSEPGLALATAMRSFTEKMGMDG